MRGAEIGDSGSLGQTHTPDKANVEIVRMRGATWRRMQLKPGWRSIIGISVTATIVWLAPLAAADEGITLLNGDTAAVKGRPSPALCKKTPFDADREAASPRRSLTRGRCS